MAGSALRPRARARRPPRGPGSTDRERPRRDFTVFEEDRDADLRRLADFDPRKGVTLTPDTRLSVTFLSDQASGTPDFAYDAPGGGLTIVRVSAGEVCSVLALSPARGTTDLMVLLEKEFGPGITTRNWNTITRILEG